MQSAKASEIFKSSRMGLAGRYSLYKDLKAKLSNIMVLPGYLVFLYYVASLFFSLPYMYPRDTLAYSLCVFLTLTMVFRQMMRAVAITNFYGFKSMAVACLLPPIMPIRLVWGNIINLVATLKAWKLYFFGTGTKKKPRKVAWSKTDHMFLHKQVLYRYYRNIGDVLLEKQAIDVSTLSAALQTSKEEGTLIGQVLLRSDLVTEEQLAQAVASVRHQIFVGSLCPFIHDLPDGFDKDALERLLLYPLLKTKDMTIFAASEFSNIGEAAKFPGVEASEFGFVYTTKDSILKALHSPNSAASPGYERISQCLGAGAITWEQAVLAIGYYDFAADTLSYMGLTEFGHDAKGSLALTQGGEAPAAQLRPLDI
jgi:adsorption protein B